MLKREITYKDFDGNSVTEVFYFNISKPELLEMEVSVAEGFGRFLSNIVEASDNHQIVDQFKKIIMLTYGKKSDDGKFFEKSEELSIKFTQSAAYEQLYTEMMTDEGAAAAFFRGVLPADIDEWAEKMAANAKFAEKAAGPAAATT